MVRGIDEVEFAQRIFSKDKARGRRQSGFIPKEQRGPREKASSLFSARRKEAFIEGSKEIQSLGHLRQSEFPHSL